MVARKIHPQTETHPRDPINLTKNIACSKISDIPKYLPVSVCHLKRLGLMGVIQYRHYKQGGAPLIILLESH
jgi:hypothetical protein